MSTETPPPAGAPVTPPPAAPAAAPPAPAGDPSANAAFAAMRTENTALKTQLEQLSTKLTEIERKDMDEKQRLEAEKADLAKKVGELSPIQEQHAKIVAGVEKACTDAIAALPEDKRATIEALAKHAPLEERLSAIQQAAAVIGAVPVSSGTVTQPGGDPKGGLPGGPEAAKPVGVKDLGRLSFSDAFKAHAAGNPVAAPDIQTMVASEVQKALAAAGKQ